MCNLCQLNCVECWIRKCENKFREKDLFGYVCFETFKKFLEDNPFAKTIETSLQGEIFLNPDLDKILQHAYEKNVILTSHTGVNLNTITPKTAEALVKYQFRTMTVSIDGASQEVYSIYRRGGNFNKVIENIKMINYFKEKYKSNFPHLVYKFILFGHNEHEIEKAKALAKELNMEMQFDINFSPEYSPLKNPQRVRELTGLLGEGNFNFLENAYNDFITKRIDWFHCITLLREPQITVKGDFAGCCCINEPSFGINVFELGLEKTLNSEKILYAKRMLTDSNTLARKDIPCSYCHVYKFLKSGNRTIKF